MMKQKDIHKKYFMRGILVANVLRVAPFVRMVALTGSLARGEAGENSDIDFFIVAQKGRIWTARFFATVLVHLCGFRRYGSKIAGRVCLNCYQTEGNLEIHPKNKKNALDYAHLTPFWQMSRNYWNFIEANKWIIKYAKFKRSEKFYDFFPLRAIQFIFEAFIELFLNDWFEARLRHCQTKKILANPLTKKAKPNQINISDTELRFHPEKSS